MNTKAWQVKVLSPAKEYINALSPAEQGSIAADIDTMRRGDFTSVYTKKLKERIRELIVGNHRITYFQLRPLLCFVRGFRKATGKAPPKEIEYAEKIYRTIREKIRQNK